MDNKKYSQQGWVGIVLALIFVIILVVLLIPAGFHFPWHRPYQARKTACKSNMQQIIISLKLYANENSGLYPTYLGALYSGFTDELGIFNCPEFSGKNATHRPATGIYAGRRCRPLDNCDYVLVPGVKDTDPANTAVVYDKYFHKGGINICYIDGTFGTLKWLPAPRKYKEGDLVPEGFIKAGK